MPDKWVVWANGNWFWPIVYIWWNEISAWIHFVLYVIKINAFSFVLWRVRRLLSPSCICLGFRSILRICVAQHANGFFRNAHSAAGTRNHKNLLQVILKTVEISNQIIKNSSHQLISNWIRWYTVAANGCGSWMPSFAAIFSHFFRQIFQRRAPDRSNATKYVAHVHSIMCGYVPVVFIACEQFT